LFRSLNENFDILNTIDFSLLKKRFGEENIAIQRADLHQALFDAIDPSMIHFKQKVTHIRQNDNEVQLTFNQQEEKSFDYCIAADGIHSIFRQSLIPNSKPRFAHYTCWRGTSKNNGDVPYHISSEAWSRNGRFGFAPLYNGDIYWFACVNAIENDEYYQSLDKNGVAKLFSHYPESVERIIKDVQKDSFLHHDLYDIQPLHSFVYNRILLLGDAAHATTPNMGQGAGQAIEDAYELMLALKHHPSIAASFQEYNNRRINRTKKVI